MSHIKETFNNRPISILNMTFYTKEKMNSFVLVEVTGQQNYCNLYVDPTGFRYGLEGLQYSANSPDRFWLNKTLVEMDLTKEQIDKILSDSNTVSLWSYRKGQREGANHERMVCAGSGLISYCDMDVRERYPLGIK